jgi:hypothetical protein
MKRGWHLHERYAIADLDPKPWVKVTGPPEALEKLVAELERPIRYVLHPGYMRSRNDGDLHYITAGQLADLYHVDIRECRIQEQQDHEILGRREDPDLIHLYPNYSGNYKLPEKP